MLPEFTLLGHRFISYNVFAILGAVAGAVLSWRPLRRAGFSRLGTLALLVLAAAGFLVGARLWNVAIMPEKYGETFPWYTLKMKGLSLYGGVFGTAAVLLAALAVRKRPALPVLDGLVVPTAAAFCLSRVGCFLNGCCAGIRTELPWGAAFPTGLPELKFGGFSFSTAPVVHPTQLYELLLAVLGVPLAVWSAKKLRLPAGGRFFLYGAWFCAMRLAILPLRSLPYRDGITGVFYPLLYGVLIAVGIAGAILIKRKKTADA
ncbi:MAG: prolipoprotein diacylglyceryl transferase [Oscillospiraceae bacterium]|nr:prolipoprotein diacylglyceryl transferase [Oscillospiraceae bacterium]